jgi:hypothetical protein
MPMGPYFMGSPHIDTENLGCFYGLSVGDFGEVRYQIEVIGEMTILISFLFGEMTVLTWMIPDSRLWATHR